MVDVVVNHNGYNGAPADVDYSVFNPFNKQEYFHPYCAIDYSDTSNAVWVSSTCH
jgi:alpha-amylase